MEMKLSAKGRYGARLMLELALCYGQGPVLLKDIAERQEISEKYLGHLIPPLKAAGLIFSSRGVHGGYTLAKPPGEITLAEVLRAVEGGLELVECVNVPAVCHRVESCVTRDIWSLVSKKMKEELSSITLQNMAERHQQKQNLQPLMYNI
jgi:Rrf2 family protein